MLKTVRSIASRLQKQANTTKQAKKQRNEQTRSKQGKKQQSYELTSKLNCAFNTIIKFAPLPLPLLLLPPLSD